MHEKLPEPDYIEADSREPEQLFSNDEQLRALLVPYGPGKDIILGKEELPNTTDSQEAYVDIARKYMMDKVRRSKREELSRTTDLYKNLLSRDAEPLPQEEPLMTVGIALGIHDEKPETFQRTLDIIAQQEGMQQSEIVLFANHPKGMADQNDKLDTILNTFRTNHPDVRIRSLLTDYAEGEFDMNRVRAEHTDVIAYDGMKRQFSFDHPVIWLDADMRAISPSGLMKLQAAIKNTDQAVSVAAPLMQNFHIEAPNPSDAERLAQTFELVGRGITREIFERKGQRVGYTEEWGLTFSLGGYMLAGGIPQNTGTSNEAGSLINAMSNTYPAYKKIRQQIDSMTTFSRYNRTHLKDVVVSSSGRRVVDTAQNMLDAYRHDGTYAPLMAVDERNGKQVAYDNGLQAHETYRHTAASTERSLSPEQWKGMLGNLLELWIEEGDDTPHNSRNIKAYERLFPEIPYDTLVEMHDAGKKEP